MNNHGRLNRNINNCSNSIILWNQTIKKMNYVLAALGLAVLCCYALIARNKYKFRNNLKAGDECFFISKNGERLPGKIASKLNESRVIVEYNKRYYGKDINEVEPRNTF